MYPSAAPRWPWWGREWPEERRAICVWQILQADHLYGHRCVFFSCFGSATPHELWAEPFPLGKPFHPSTTKAQKILQANWAHIISFTISWWRKRSAMNSLRSKTSADSNKLCNLLSNQTLYGTFTCPSLTQHPYLVCAKFKEQLSAVSFLVLGWLQPHVWALSCTNTSAQNRSIWYFAGKSPQSSAGAELQSVSVPLAPFTAGFCHVVSLLSSQPPLHFVVPVLFCGLEELKVYFLIKIWMRRYSVVKQTLDTLRQWPALPAGQTHPSSAHRCPQRVSLSVFQ